MDFVDGDAAETEAELEVIVSDARIKRFTGINIDRHFVLVNERMDSDVRRLDDAETRKAWKVRGTLDNDGRDQELHTDQTNQFRNGIQEKRGVT